MIPRFTSLLLIAASSLHAAFTVNDTTAALTQLSLGKNEYPLVPASGGFTVEDFPKKEAIVWEKTTLTEEGNSRRFAASSKEIQFKATFTPKDEVIEVSGEITSQRASDSAVIVRYVLPLRPDRAVVEKEFGAFAPLPVKSPILGTVYPIIAETTAHWGAALSIPPETAVCFGMTGSDEGLGVEFYLGLSARQLSSPNKASFRFTISSATPGWGFRSALAAYQKRNPEYYKPAFVPQGLWLWSERGAIDFALPLYQTHSITHTKDFDAHLTRDKKAGISVFDYVIVGQREIRNLPALPANDAEAMKEFKAFDEKWKSEGPDGPLHKAYTNWRDQDLAGQVERSAIGKLDGSYRMRIRQTGWGGNSVTFVMNPSPYLFADKKLGTVGSTTLDKVKEWITQEPRLDGIHVDSLGAQWPSWLNYRKDHAAYARYPLTFSPSGTVAVHNHLSHCEFLDGLRDLLHAHGKWMLGNGLYRYGKGEKEQPLEENYNGSESSRWFEAARLDAAVREFEKLPPRDDLEFFRGCMGQKYYGGILYKWDDPEMVRRFLNRALVYTLFAAPHRNGNENKGSYLESPVGYPRDKELLGWFLEKMRMLAKAGWQSVTNARVDQADIACERYGDGDTVYLALNNFSEKGWEGKLSIDLAALGFTAGKVQAIRCEGAKGIPVDIAADGATTLKLEPDTAQIIALSKVP